MRWCAVKRTFKVQKFPVFFLVEVKNKDLRETLKKKIGRQSVASPSSSEEDLSVSEGFVKTRRRGLVTPVLSACNYCRRCLVESQGFKERPVSLLLHHLSGRLVWCFTLGVHGV